MEAPANIFLENPSNLKTQEMNLVPSVAAESRALEPWLQAVLILPGLQNLSPLKRKKTGHVLVGRAWGRLQKPHVCTIKSWLPPEGSQHKLKETELCRKPNKGQLGFFNNLQAFRSCLERSLLEMGLASQTHSFLHGLFCPQNLNMVFFPVPTFR